MQHHRRTLPTQGPTRGSSLRPRLSRAWRIVFCGVLFTLAVAPAAVAQVFPTNATPIFCEDFESYTPSQTHPLEHRQTVVAVAAVGGRFLLDRQGRCRSQS